MSTLLLRLAAPMQAWGVDSDFETRRTLSYPTKSGVIGMLAAALGRSREDSLDDLNQLGFGVRIDQEGELLRDYHTARPADMKSGNDSYITVRYYLCDAIFLVGIESDDRAVLEQLEFCLQHPAYPLYLGRRSCPITLPLILGIWESDLLSALSGEEWLVQDDYARKKRADTSGKVALRILLDGDENTSNASVLKDVPVSFSKKNRKFTYRKVGEYYTEVDAGSEEDVPVPTEHDPMAELQKGG